MKVPDWLTHLRTDRRGIPVPYINLWGPEDADRLAIRYDGHVDHPGIFLDDTDQTVPDFTRQHMGRQRECMVAGLCQVCARRVPWPRRQLVIADLSVSVVELAGRQVTVVTEPWLCPDCAAFATSTCPALIRRARTENLTLVPVTAPAQVQFIVSKGWVDGPLEALSRRWQPALWVKAALTGVDVQLGSPVPS